MDLVDTITYLGVAMQSNFKFDQHITLEKNVASKVSEAIKHILHEASRECTLLAHTSLCSPILEYADTVWDSTLAEDIESVEMLLAQGSEVYCWIKRTRNCHRSMLSAGPSASQTEIQESLTIS